MTRDPIVRIVFLVVTWALLFGTSVGLWAGGVFAGGPAAGDVTFIGQLGVAALLLGAMIGIAIQVRRDPPPELPDEIALYGGACRCGRALPCRHQDQETP